MRRNLGEYSGHDYDEDDLDDFSILDEDEDEFDELDLLGDPDSELDDDDVEISMEVDADGNEIYYAQDAKVPDSHSQGYSAEEVIEGLEQRRREFREMRKRSRSAHFDEEESDDLAVDDVHANGDGVNISMEIDEEGNERWYATDPKVPGSASMGLSAEEAVDGLEDRRQEYREMLRKSRAKSKRKHREE
jgi:predicted RNase H-like HicB family nuclease